MSAADTQSTALAAARKLWHDHGPRGLTHNALAGATGKSKGNLQHYWPRANDLVRATALAIVSNAQSSGNWPGIVAYGRGQLTLLDGEAFSRDDLIVAEAYVWLARHGKGES